MEHRQRTGFRERMRTQEKKLAKLRVDVRAAECDGNHEEADAIREQIRKTIRKHTLVK